MGGRGASSGIAKTATAKNVRKIEGVTGYFTDYRDVSSSSPNTIWIGNTSNPHASLNNSEKSLHIKGNKKEPFALLENVNTAKVVLRAVGENNPTRDVNRLNREIKEIKSYGFDVPKIYAGRDETVLYVKRKLFTKSF